MQKKWNKKLLSLILSTMLIVAMAFSMTACSDEKENPTADMQVDEQKDINLSVGDDEQKDADVSDGDSTQKDADVLPEDFVVGRYVDSGLSSHTEYFYRVCAVNNDGICGEMSNVFSALTKE